MAEVAEAILELEANADSWLFNKKCCDTGDLARKAWDRAPWRCAPTADVIATRYLEAAALLRDGWRPRKRSKR